MKPQNNDLNSYIYILYYQSNMFIILYQIRLVFLLFEIKHCLTEVLEQLGSRTPALNVMDTRPTSRKVSKQRTLLADADVAPHHSSAPIT